jgi:hypothetical protein
MIRVEVFERQLYEGLVDYGVRIMGFIGEINIPKEIKTRWLFKKSGETKTKRGLSR